MAKANSFEHISITAVKVLARLAAKRIVQAQLRDQGVRVTLVKPAEISALAGELLAQHPDRFIPDAKAKVERMTAEGVFGKRGTTKSALL
jgi:hypothetical protein